MAAIALGEREEWAAPLRVKPVNRAFNFQVTIRKHFSVTDNSLTEFRPVWVQKNEINHRGRTPA